MKNPKIIALIQARMGSTRLPGKIMLPLAGKPAISHVYERTALIHNVDQVAILTSTSKREKPLIDLCGKEGYTLFQGSETDVLDRYFQAAVAFGADIIIRITGDCPLIDPVESNKVVEELLRSGVDYCSNTNPPYLPDGLDTEVFTFSALERAWKQAKKQQEREHVTLYMYSNPDVFSTRFVKYSNDYGHLRLTLDEEPDFHLLEKVFNHLAAENKFGNLKEILDILKKYPRISNINQEIKRNEGLLKKSLP